MPPDGNFWLNLLHGLADWIFTIAQTVCGWFPSADISGLTAPLANVGSVLGWAMLANHALPISDMIAALSLWALLYGGLHSGNLMRRGWSMWTGGGGA